jgi:hypothetical protein
MITTDMSVMWHRLLSKGESSPTTGGGAAVRSAVRSAGVRCGRPEYGAVVELDARLTVLGRLNMDISVTVPVLPGPEATVLGGAAAIASRRSGHRRGGRRRYRRGEARHAGGDAAPRRHSRRDRL